MIRAIGIVLAALLVQDGEAIVPDTATVATQYIETNFLQRDLDRSGALLAEDAVFVDPTGEIFGGPLATGVHGRDAIVGLQRSWGVQDFGFEIELEFVAGEYAVHAGQLDMRYANGSSFDGVPFATVLRVRDGQVIERRDYGDYSKLVQAPEVEPDLEVLAQSYLDAYFGRRFAEVEALLSEGAAFENPIGALIVAGARFEGRAAVRANFERAFAGSRSFEFDPTYSFFFQHHAVFGGTCSVSLAGSAVGLEVEEATFEIPLFVALEIRDGEIVEHRDYADHATYAKQLEAQRPGAK